MLADGRSVVLLVACVAWATGVGATPAVPGSAEEELIGLDSECSAGSNTHACSLSALQLRAKMVQNTDSNQSSAHCEDSPETWRDSRGFPCATYVQMSWCTPAGELGTGWKTQWGGFAKWAVDGKAADTACCSCGGGSCVDSPKFWRDKKGFPCTAYVNMSWCTPSGQPGTGWHKHWGDFADWAVDGEAADTVCCGCGGANSTVTGEIASNVESTLDKTASDKPK
mmetsp:Transcript_45567/g.114853  ORF Transcript_45567/g.114853 Transcript_45567/m.114853 type:complete len:225 (+) Transcript_45567:108-782(+)